MTDNQKQLIDFSTKLPKMSTIKGKSSPPSPKRIDEETVVITQPQAAIVHPKRNKRKKRCALKGCKKKLKLTSMECRCKQKFCSAHFHYEKHNCTFDYIKLYRGKLGIASANGSRVDKIENRI